MNSNVAEEKNRGNARPLVSIGLMVYNGEPFIRNALNSLLAQTFTDFELVVSDNGSVDQTEVICREFAARDERVRYYRSPTNNGAGWNTRKVIELSTGKYFKLAACDDYCEPGFLQACVNALEGDRSAILAYPKTRVVDQTGKFLEDYEWPMQTEDRNCTIRFRDLLLNDHKCYQIYGLIRLQHLREVPPPGSFVNSDGVLLAELSLRGKFLEVPERLFLSTFHRGQSSQTIPERVKTKGLRLTKRYGTLPSPEWWDPTNKQKITLPEWRQLSEYARSIARAPISGWEKLRCFAFLPSWIGKHLRRLAKDLLIAADQVLYRLQVRFQLTSI